MVPFIKCRSNRKWTLLQPTQYGEVGELLGYPVDHPKVAPYLNGQYAIIYLPPKDYHRVHSAQEGQLFGLPPWKIRPVLPAATRQIPNLFDETSGYRAIKKQLWALCACNDWCWCRKNDHRSQLTTTNTGGKASTQAGEWPIEMAYELGRFELESTAILLWPKTQIKWAMHGSSHQAGQPNGQQPQTPDDICTEIPDIGYTSIMSNSAETTERPDTRSEGCCAVRSTHPRARAVVDEVFYATQGGPFNAESLHQGWNKILSSPRTTITSNPYYCGTSKIKNIIKLIQRFGPAAFDALHFRLLDTDLPPPTPFPA